ncbi:MAG: hypothetical protein Q8S58_20710 [Bosea sp. (in: a-proteobacteria)]|uniref:hypothetical protein n=1 Tax=Bosea sp. (in: a-proteobacteria) TaxID=1871050 RepID=UPI0027327264|nr:hypothetical protein [Bosea sp. (in: a-proteobacteria)]MDP3255113.1 hypothetical protein [Bosea sp. (in: a-proteobacteria)]MDP3321552.1 hypothetical protein [Bosea sp. (in: a-proteobacteria)]
MSLSRELLSKPGCAVPAVPCTNCLCDLGEASGMAGALSCPLKIGLLRRLADRRGMAAADTLCDAYVPGFADEPAPGEPWAFGAGRPLS